MIKEFADLPQADQQALLDAIPRITVLIAAADGNISEEEVKWGEKLAHIRSYASDPELQSYYEALDHNMDDKINGLIRGFGTEATTKEIVAKLTEELAGLNDILPKLPHFYRQALYKSFISFAKHIAQADGGFMGFFSIDGEEKDLIDLPMITPVV